MKSFVLAVLATLLFSACATSTGYVEPTPLTLGPRAIMTARTCTEMPHDSAPNVNSTPGWAQAVPGIVGYQCGSKYGSGPFYCASPANCPGPLIWGTHPNEKNRSEEWHGIIDLMEGSILACAEQANKQAVHSADCPLAHFTATKGSPRRLVLPVIVPPLLSGSAEQTATTVQLRVLAAPGSGPIVIGQLGFAEQAQ
jgi:hypothetical protein